MSATKKWKTTLRVERPTGRSISLGAHLEVNGIWQVSPRLGCRLQRSCTVCSTFCSTQDAWGVSMSTRIMYMPVRWPQNRGACTACRTTGPPPPGVQGAAEFARPAQPAAPEPKPILHGLSQPQRAPSASPQAAARPPPAAVKPEAVLEQGVSVPISAEAPKVSSGHCTLKAISEFQPCHESRWESDTLYLHGEPD